MKLGKRNIYHGTDGHPFTNLFWKMVWGADRFSGSQQYMAEAFFEIGNYLADPEQAADTNQIVAWAKENPGKGDEVHYYIGKRVD